MKAGFAKLEITSPLGSNLNGYFTVRPAQDVVEPLYANALAFSDGENTVLAISLDISEIIQKDVVRVDKFSKYLIYFVAIF